MANKGMKIRPSIYIAGKIAKDDFRQNLVPGLRGWEAMEGPIECDGFDYVGPFFRSCDHGCYHQPGSHGLAASGCGGIEITHRQVFDRNQAALVSADMLLAFIDAPDCYGTLVEIGWAACTGIPIYLAFAPGIDHAELWYAQMASASPVTSLVTKSDLAAFIARAIFDWRCRQ